MNRQLKALSLSILGSALLLCLTAGQAAADPNDLVWSTFLGGGDSELGYDIIADETGYAFVIGNTESSDFPTIYGSYDSTSTAAPPTSS